MTPLHRWKLISLVLAGCVSYSWWHGEASSGTASAPVHARYKGQLRISAAALGISTDELIRELFAAKTYDEMKPLAQRLGMVGDDAAIDAVRPLVDDPREGVPDLIIDAFGAIATNHAVDVLIELARDPRDEIRGAAAESLGATHSPRGEPILIELAERPDEVRISAMRGLAELASDRAIEVLARLAGHTDEDAAAAVRALATIDKPAAHAALVALVDAPSVSVAAAAIGQLTERDLDPELITKLTAIVHAGDRTLVAPALAALANAGEAGVPVLREASLHGPIELRATAMGYLAEADRDAAIETLRTILENESGRAADAAALALAGIDSDDARDALISAALADESNGRIVQYLLRQHGPDVEQALLVIAKSESGERWQAVSHLVKGGNAEALEVAVAEARTGDAEQRLSAMRALAAAGTSEATEALVGLVDHGGEVKARALEILAGARPDDPRVGKLLADALRSSDPEVAGAAASALAKVGTSDARDALVGALASSDSSVVANAASSLASYRMTDDMTAALRRAVAAHPELEPQVMAQLVGAGSPLGIELARKALTGDSPDLASRAISSLEQAGTPAALDALVEGARVGDAQVRAEAVASLGNVGDSRAPDLVAQAMRDSEPAVRVSAARALGQLATPKARDLLVQMTRSSDESDRRAAVASLSRFEGTDTTRRLSELVRDPSFGVAYAAVDALSDRNDGVPALRSLVTDTAASTYIRYQAARMLTYRGISDPTIDRVLNQAYDDD